MAWGSTERVRFGRKQNDGAATAVSKFHTHSIPLDMEDIERDWDTPILDAGIAAKSSVIVRVGMLDLSAGTGSYRVRQMMHRVAYPLGVHVRADVNLTDIAATCTDGKERITEVIDLPTTGVNTERIWLLEHFADWFNANLGKGSMYHATAAVSEDVVEHLDAPGADASVLRAVERQIEQDAAADEAQDGGEAKVGIVPPLKDAVVGLVHGVDLTPAAQTPQSEQRDAGSGKELSGDQSSGNQPDDHTANRNANEPVDGDAGERVGDRADDGTGRREDVHADRCAEQEHREDEQTGGHEDGCEDGSGHEGSYEDGHTAGRADGQTEHHAGSRPNGRTGRNHRAHRRFRISQTDRYAEHFAHMNDDAVPGGIGPGLTVRQVHDRLDLIEHRAPLYPAWFSGLCAALACASFVFLLGGGVYDMIGAFVGAGLGQWLRRKLLGRHLNQFFVTFVCVCVAALACVGVLRLIGLADPVALQHDTAYIGAILFVIPGFPLITGGLDLVKIDFPSGIQRLAYTLTVILMATLAAWMVASLVHLNPEGFEPLGLDPVVNNVLRFVAAFIGVWGFSVLFNSPQRMCFVAALIGATTDTLRLIAVDYGLSAELGAFLGALLAGLLATAWRASVRRGWLPPHLDYPRICLTVPSIVIMVPGMYMYQAMFYLGQMDTQQALDWAFRAFMVIICLPIGLAMARVITDKSWRYDV